MVCCHSQRLLVELALQSLTIDLRRESCHLALRNNYPWRILSVKMLGGAHVALRDVFDEVGGLSYMC